MEIKSTNRFETIINADANGKLIRKDSQDVEYFFCDLNDLSPDAGDQIGRQIKFVRYDRLPVVFDKYVAGLAELAKNPSSKVTYNEAEDNYYTTEKSVKINVNSKGAFYSVEVPPYYRTNSDGSLWLKTRGKDAGKPSIAKKVTFFAFAGEEPVELLDNACYNLQWVDADDAAEPLEEELAHRAEQQGIEANPPVNRAAQTPRRG